MGKKVQDTSSSAQYGNIAHSPTSDEASYRDSAAADYSSPINAAYGSAANNINDTTFEDALPAGVAERIKSGRMFKLDEDKGAALANAAGQQARFKSGVLGNLAAMTQDHFVQTGGTSHSTGNTFGPAFASTLGSTLGGGKGG